ncbi:MAG TPA: E3 binding domain-containing protein [Phycisphaerae bacterium]|nr:E3 binding domain-containing protein [Phycisphaerae bacterium]
MNLVLQAQEWESESTDALREAVGRYVETKAPGAGLEWAKATPAAREAAEQLGVRLGEVTPTGKDGAILERDVRRAALTRDKETTARVRGLRQKIRAVVAERGLPETEWRELAKEVSGHRHLAATRVTEEHLEEILRRVQAARPQQIRRGTGFVQVIRPKTEQKIQTLRERLGTIGQMTDEDFGNILAGMKIQEPRYVSAQNFVTEAQGHDVLRAMLDAAPSIGKRTARESALAFPHEGAPPNVREAWETADRQIKEKAKKVAEKPHPVHVRPLWDMRYYSQFWEEKTGAPVSEAVQEVLDARAGIERDVETGIHDRLAQAIGEKELARLTADPAACRRIEDWLASELKRGGPEKPADVTPTEVKAAETIRDILRDYETPVRIARFYDYWENDAKIPDATPEQLQEATDILETQGHEALERHLATQTWGTIETGYTPLSVVRAKVRTYQLPPTALGKGHLQSRGGLYLEQERTIFQRLNSYAYQILGLTRLRRPIRSFVQVFDQASGQMKSPGKVASVFSTWLDEIKGYPARYHPMSAFVRRVYAQAMTAVVLIDPRKWVRNKFQNLAFYPDRTDFLNPRNKTLTPEDREYFRKHVSQRFGLLQHYFMSAEKPFWGFRHITEWARKLSLYPLTDETNRWECFWAKINRVRRALAAHPQDAEAMQKAANMMDLELVQRREALRILAADGPDAMARYVASQVTYNVHFAYDRAMRAPIEQGDVGRILGNLMTFPRSYGQQLALSARQITHGETPGVRLRGFKKFVNLIVGATVAGWLFQLITGDKNNPYNPMNVLRWNMGGLSVGAVQEGFETMGDIMQAVKGDRQALDRLAIGIPRCADLFVPFYRQLTNAAEGVTGYKDLDRLALRKVRALVDKRYGGPQTERYKVDRNAVQIMQKILMGVEAHDAKQAAQVPADSISKIRAAIRERQEAQETDLQERIKAGQPRTQIMAEFVRQQPQKDRDRLRDRTDLLLAYKNVDPWWKRLEGMPTIESRAMAFAERYEAANANEQKRLLALLRKLPGLVPKEEKSRDRFWATFRRHLNDLKTGKAKP